jgi:polyvinyl alcohol dehydrogenase (cytochrome)
LIFGVGGWGLSTRFAKALWRGLRLAVVLFVTPPQAVAADWPFAGRDIHNTRDAGADPLLDPARIAGLRPRWSVVADGALTATPAVVNGVVYMPDFGGSLWAIDAVSGTVVWKQSISRYTGVPGDVSRTTPAYWDGALIMGDGAQITGTFAGASVFALEARSGRLLWRQKVDAKPAAIITSSPIVDDGVVYLGVSSKAELLDGPTGFRGSVQALDARTGAVIWRTFVTPVGYTGVAVWGSTPVVDRETGLIYVATGNNYTAPPGVCRSPGEFGCAAPSSDDDDDSILALDRKTGRIVWATHTLAADVSKDYGRDPGPDYDFGQGPMLFTTLVGGRATRLLGAGQKSGVYWALDPATGRVVWRTKVGPGGHVGGMMWGSASDGRRIYVAIANSDNQPVRLTSPSGVRTTTGGFWAALDAASGEILWATPDPQGAADVSALTVSGGLVFAGSMAGQGETMYALDAATGAVKWSFASGGSVAAGPAIADGAVYWGSGSTMSETHKLLAFRLTGR